MTVRDLQAALAGMDPEAVVVVEDPHERGYAAADIMPARVCKRVTGFMHETYFEDYGRRKARDGDAVIPAVVVTAR